MNQTEIMQRIDDIERELALCHPVTSQKKE